MQSQYTASNMQSARITNLGLLLPVLNVEVLALAHHCPLYSRLLLLLSLRLYRRLFLLLLGDGPGGRLRRVAGSDMEGDLGRMTDGLDDLGGVLAGYATTRRMVRQRGVDVEDRTHRLRAAGASSASERSTAALTPRLEDYITAPKP